MDQRSALALTQLAGLPQSEARSGTGFDDDNAFSEAVEQARNRVAAAAGRADGATVIDLLHRVLIEAPAAELWPEIEGPVSRAWSSRRRRERLLTAGTITGIVLIIATAVIWVSGYRLGGDGDEPAPARLAMRIRDEVTAPASTEVDDDIASFAAVSTLEPSPANPVTVADIQLLRVIEQAGARQSAVQLYDALSNTASPLLDAGGPPLVTPDGRWIVTGRKLPESPGRSTLAAGAVDGSASWQSEIANPRAIAVGSDRIFALNLANVESLQIQAINLREGSITETWPQSIGEFAPSAMRSARLILSSDEERLFVLTEWAQPEGDHWIRKITALQAASGEVLNEIETRIKAPLDDSVRDFSVGSARPVPGENAIYSTVQDRGTSQVRLQFFDLETGDLTGIVLPIAARLVPLATQRGENEIHLVPSNTGRMLYVIQSRQRRVAVVDMQARRLIGVFPLSSPDEERVMFEGSLNHVTFLEALLSPNGTRLYLASNRERNQAINSYPSQSPVWVINTTTWEVADRWMVSGLPRRMTMSGDGSALYVRSARADGRVYLTTLDTTSGSPINVWDALPSPGWADIQRIVSLAQIYHEQYGVRPTSGPAPAVDNPILSVLPGVRVESDNAIAGAESIVTASIVHPLTGEPASTDGTLRFDPSATLAIELIGPAEQTIVVPFRVEPGIYQGRIRLNAGGSWDARVTVINQDGATWTVEQPEAFDVAEGLIIGDGQAYRFRVRPANPVNRRTITLRVTVVDAQTRDRLPEGSEFLDRISQDARIILTHPEGGVLETPLTRIDHSTFMGWARFGSAGLWNAEIIVTLGDGEHISVNAGSVEIHDLTEPFRRSGSSTPSGGAGSPSD